MKSTKKKAAPMVQHRKRQRYKPYRNYNTKESKSQCGREIHKGEGIYDVNDEKWCSDCVSGCYTFPDDEPNYENET